MVDELQRLFEEASRQPEDVQHRLAQLWRLELEEEEAEELEASSELLARLEESRGEIARGEYVTLEVGHRRDVYR